MKSVIEIEGGSTDIDSLPKMEVAVASVSFAKHQMAFRNYGYKPRKNWISGGRGLSQVFDNFPDNYERWGDGKIE